MTPRALTTDDLDALLELWRRAGLDTVRPAGRDSHEALTRQLASAAQCVLGVERNGRLAGVVVATHDGRKGWINRLAVGPEWRRQGLGRLLLQAAEQWLHEQGIEVLGALIEDANPTSLALFQGAGYSRHPTIHYLSKRPRADA